MDYHFNSIYHCIIVVSNVLHHFQLHLIFKSLSCLNNLCSLTETSELFHHFQKMRILLFSHCICININGFLEKFTSVVLRG